MDLLSNIRSSVVVRATPPSSPIGPRWRPRLKPALLNADECTTVYRRTSRTRTVLVCQAHRRPSVIYHYRHCLRRIHYTLSSTTLSLRCVMCQIFWEWLVVSGRDHL